VIGLATIDHNRCLAWGEHTPCIVCEEMCPIPDKAIYLETVSFQNRDGGQVEIQLPHVDPSRCIGCGICEYKCPLTGSAAIRVYTASASTGF
jgi:ferredoxin